MLNANRAMVDTSALYALICAGDEFHDEAAFIHRELVDIVQSNIQVIWIDGATHWSSWDLLHQNNGNLSLVDGSVILVARRLNCAVFTFDRDFHDAGLAVLP